MRPGIAVSAISMDYSDGDRYIKTRVRVKSTGKTCVEREALTGAALLTIWKRVKSAENNADGQYPVIRMTIES